MIIKWYIYMLYILQINSTKVHTIDIMNVQIQKIIDD